MTGAWGFTQVRNGWVFVFRRSVAIALLLSFIPVASTSAAEASPGRARGAVILVHGIDDDSSVFQDMREAIATAGFVVNAVDLVPNNGDLDIPALAMQVGAAARALMAEAGAERVDVVGFSMGALVSRWWIQRGGGSASVRRFISLSGPHHGTATAWFRFNDGARSMRFGSPLLKDLESDEGEWGDVEVFAWWTPFDLMIVPPGSSRLAGARHRTFPVALHPWMLTDTSVIRAVVEELRR